jgi:hypothetical protein
MLIKNFKIRFAIFCFSIVLGYLTGVIINFLWYLFLALVVGWGDSAPEWYIEIQKIIFNTILIISVIIWIIGSQWFYHRRNKERIAKQTT